MIMIMAVMAVVVLIALGTICIKKNGIVAVGIVIGFLCGVMLLVVEVVKLVIDNFGEGVR